jgi:acetyltransferase-like isoleucine patch superfamily enzyme
MMLALAKRAARWYWQARFRRNYPGTVTLGKDCGIPFSLKARVSTLVIGDYVRLGDRLFLSGDTFTFGDHFYCGNDVVISGAEARFEVGKFSSFAARVAFILGRGRHRPQSLSNAAFGHIPQFDSPDWCRHFDYAAESKSECRVGADVWIGTASVILPNVTIGHGAIVAANSVVTQDVPPYAIVGGNPAQVVAFRFKQTLIAELLQLSWWDWPFDRINRNKALFTRNLTTLTSLNGIPIVD